MAKKKSNWLSCLGTRPEAIKLLPVIQSLLGDLHFRVVNIVTAQHREMLDQVLKTFNIRPHHDMGIMKSDRDTR
jgi:UDP-N-acetylglucosamine 2-epimerase (non-hydrolysing)